MEHLNHFYHQNMNQLCKVCGEPAAGFHFGAFTCEGCKSFFGRTYNNLSSLNDCKNNGKCIINKKNRTSCKSCRLRKCLMVGMSKSGSRYGRRSNWFKIHCLLQEQTGMDSTLQSLGGSVGGVDSDDTTKPLGLDTRDDLLPNKGSSPVLSSPESQISENSVEVSDSLRASRLMDSRNFMSNPFLATHRQYFNPMTGLSPPSPSLSPHILPQPIYTGLSEAIARRQYLDRFMRQQHKPFFMGGEAPEQERPIDLSLNKSSNNSPPPVTTHRHNHLFQDSVKSTLDDPHHPLDLSLRMD